MNTAAATTRTLMIEKELRHPAEKVWRALTQGPLLEDWLMANDFLPVVGHRFHFRAPPQPHWNGIVEAEVLAVEPHHRLAYTWNASGAEADNGLKTVVTWTLTPTPNGVIVRMEQAGFRPEDQFNYQGAAYGWKHNLDRLERTLDTQA